MSDTILIALITGAFGLLGKVVDVLLTRAKTADASAQPRRRKRSDAVNPFTSGGILNPATIGFLVLGVIVGVIIVNATGNPPVFPTKTPSPTPPDLDQTSTPAAHVTEPATSESTGLRIGGKAIVHTTGGDRLRMHEQPSFDSATTERLDPSTVVTVVEGPHTVGADNWWRIELADGRSGWVVESVEGVQTILPLAP